MPVLNQQYTEGQVSMGYKLFLPEQYEANENERYPLILFLHGIKKRGNDLRLLDGYGLTAIAEQGVEFPFIIIAPQCPEGTFWPENRRDVLDILHHVNRKYRVDQNCIYLTGFSMGGNGVWDLAANTEGVFAAAAPLAGWFDPSEAIKLISIPIWAFHGEDDDTVPIARTSEMIQALKEAGGTPKFTKYPGLNHAIMNIAYEGQALFEWFMKNKKEDES